MADNEDWSTRSILCSQVGCSSDYVGFSATKKFLFRLYVVLTSRPMQSDDKQQAHAHPHTARRRIEGSGRETIELQDSEPDTMAAFRHNVLARNSDLLLLFLE
jgi:hypothetical protein